MMPDEHPPADGPDDAERRDHTEFVSSLIPGLDLSAGLADALDDVARYSATVDRLSQMLHLREGLRAALAAGANRRSTRADDTDPRNATIRPLQRLRQCALPGCEVMIEQMPGQPAPKYCSPAHRKARRAARRGGQDNDQINDPEHPQAEKKSARPSVGASALLRTAGAISYPDSDAVARPGPPPRRPSPPRRRQPPTDWPRRPAASSGRPESAFGGRTSPTPNRPERTERNLTLTAADLTDDYLLPPRAERPTTGWRAALYAASRGRINPGMSKAEATRNALLRRSRRPLPGAHQIAVCSLKGGVGKTTVSAVLGLTLAEHRGDSIVAVDANPDAVTLADRLTGEIGVTVRQLLDNIDTIDSLTAMSRYTSLAGRLEVLASEQDPAMSEAFNRDEYEQIRKLLSRFYNIIITDSGTGLVHSAMEGTLALADSLVVVGAPTTDGASRASKALDWLVAHGYAEQVADAVVVLCSDRVNPQIDRERVRTHLLGRTRAVVEIPHDPHLATGGRLDLGAMREPTKHAFLELAAHIADEFSA
jgi:MinD-like ATPase involved in chromosome partitioning or flagellar assembly